MKQRGNIRHGLGWKIWEKNLFTWSRFVSVTITEWGSLLVPGKVFFLSCNINRKLRPLCFICVRCMTVLHRFCTLHCNRFGFKVHPIFNKDQICLSEPRIVCFHSVTHSEMNKNTAALVCNKHESGNGWRKSVVFSNVRTNWGELQALFSPQRGWVRDRALILRARDIKLFPHHKTTSFTWDFTKKNMFSWVRSDREGNLFPQTFSAQKTISSKDLNWCWRNRKWTKGFRAQTTSTKLLFSTI